MAEPITKAGWAELADHLPDSDKHEIQVANYGRGTSLTVECVRCGVLLLEVPMDHDYTIEKGG